MSERDITDLWKGSDSNTWRSELTYHSGKFFSDVICLQIISLALVLLFSHNLRKSPYLCKEESGSSMKKKQPITAPGKFSMEVKFKAGTVDSREFLNTFVGRKDF